MAPTYDDYRTILESIKDKFDKNRMSALVGAGFSKNFNNDIFPSWWQLLRDMVKESRENIIKEKYDLLPKKNREKYANYLDRLIDRHIDEIGPLMAVSNYIKKMGYREAVDYRIEEATPVIEEEDKILYITYLEKGKRIKRKIKDGEMRIHEKFVNLPWNNIYTTNYDNLLENSIDLNIKDQFDERVNNLREQLNTLIEEIDKKNKKVEELKNKLPVEYDHHDISAFKKTSTINGSKKSGDNLEEIRELKKLNWTLYDLTQKRQELIKNLTKYERLQGEFSSLVTHSSDLSIKKNGNIIKIHGSVRTSKNNQYGFDGDIRKHYVISQDDFDTYPEKHQAFTQLMRISLLQESFCIIGFSGIDPNFLAWIDWVRDIIEKKPENSDNKDKIYLIDVSNDASNADRELFYRNHGITIISLRDPNCKLFLEKETGRTLISNPENRDLVELFIDYLHIDRSANKFQIAYQITKSEDYKSILQDFLRSSANSIENLLTPHPSEKSKQLKVWRNNKAETLIKLKEFNRIPILEWPMSNDKYHFIRSAESYLSEIKDPKELENYLTVIICSIEDQLLTTSILFYQLEKVYKKLVSAARKTNKKIFHRFLIFNLKDAVWQNDKKKVELLVNQLIKINDLNISQEVTYQQALHAIFNFNFSKLEEILEEWKPIKEWILKKAGLLSFYNPKAAIKILESNTLENLQDHLYQLERLAHFSVLDLRKQNSEYIQKAKFLENNGLKSSNDNVTHLLNNLNKDKEEILPYGYGKFSISETINFGGTPKFLLSLQLFNHMLEVGIPISIPQVRRINPKEIHTAFEATYKTFPFPLLFFICQYNEEKIILKLAQDYAYSDSIRSSHEPISGIIQTGYFDTNTPYLVKKNLLIFYSEFVNVLRADLWENFFVKVWNEGKLDLSIFDERAINKKYFIEHALRFIQRPHDALMVINDALESLTSKQKVDNQNTIIQMLYELANNKFLSKTWNADTFSPNDLMISELIKRVPNEPELMFIFGNIDYALTQNQKDELIKTISQTSEFPDSDQGVWRIMLFYNEDGGSSNIKNSILKSKRLWDAGFIEKGITTDSYNYISLYRLRNGTSENGIEWNQNEVNTIYNRMIEELTKLENYLNKDRETHRYKSILQEMLWFLDFEKKKLEEQEGYQQTLERVKTLYNNQRRYSTTMKGLISHEKSDVIWAVNEVSYQLYNYKSFHDEHQHLKVILNKILLRSSGGLAAAFGTLADWTVAFRNEKEIKQYKKLLEEILDQYLNDAPQEIDAPFLEEKLIKIAYTLDLWKSEHPAVAQTLKLISTSRFNSTLITLAHTLYGPKAELD